MGMNYKVVVSDEMNHYKMLTIWKLILAYCKPHASLHTTCGLVSTQLKL